MEKKEINSKTTIKAIVTGFVSYGIIINFICLLIFAVGSYALKSILTSPIKGLYITLPLMAAIFIYFIIHIICKLSTYDVFKKCKTNPENYKKITKYLTIFFIICIFLSVIVFLSLLNLNLQYQLKSIDYAVLKYNQIFSADHTAKLEAEMLDTFNASKENLTISTIILEIGFSISFLSLIPYQRKMILKYNEF